jgi:hypothetical protein
MKRLAPALLLLAACKGDGVTGPTGTPLPSGPLSGSYTFAIQPAPGCQLPALPEIAMTAAADGTGAQPEVRITEAGTNCRNPSINCLQLLFLLPTSNTVEGSLGTKGPLAVGGGLFLYVRAGGEGTITRASDGRGEVLDGRMFGDVATGPTGDLNDATGYCTSAGHRWTLRAR